MQSYIWSIRITKKRNIMPRLGWGRIIDTLFDIHHHFSTYRAKPNNTKDRGTTRDLGRKEWSNICLDCSRLQPCASSPHCKANQFSPHVGFILPRMWGRSCRHAQTPHASNAPIYVDDSKHISNTQDRFSNNITVLVVLLHSFLLVFS